MRRPTRQTAACVFFNFFSWHRSITYQFARQPIPANLPSDRRAHTYGFDTRRARRRTASSCGFPHLSQRAAGAPHRVTSRLTWGVTDHLYEPACVYMYIRTCVRPPRPPLSPAEANETSAWLSGQERARRPAGRLQARLMHCNPQPVHHIFTHYMQKSENSPPACGGTWLEYPRGLQALAPS